MNEVSQSYEGRRVRDPDINSVLIRALSALQAGRHAEARRLLVEVLAADGDNEEAWQGLKSLAASRPEPIGDDVDVAERKPGDGSSVHAAQDATPAQRYAVPSPPGGSCPHLGLQNDPATNFLYPDTSHRCYATGRARPVDEEHQEAFCLADCFSECPRYVKPVVKAAPVPVPVAAYPDDDLYDMPEPPSEFSLGRVAMWALVGLALVFVGLRYGPAFVAPAPSPTADRPVRVVSTLTATPTATPEATPTVETTAQLIFAQATPTPTPPPGGANFALSPAAEAVGWVVSSEERGNHFGDSHLYSGIFNGDIYHGALQFDLSAVPRGAPILSARLQLAGLNKDRLGEGGTWEVRVLTDTLDYDWPALNYQTIHNATVLQSLLPVLTDGDLAVRRINEFTFGPEQLRLLEQRVLNNPRISLRIDGPLTGANNVFSWDSGYGPETQGFKPVLFVSAAAPPATPPPRDYVVVTNTPTPENVLTAGAIVARLTADATSTGTATPTPRNMVTATPADWIVVTNTPEPANAATAQHLAAMETAVALTTGTSTATPPNLATATPSPTWVLVTSVPTPGNALTAQARAVATATAAQIVGTPTPLPPGWVTPIVVTSTPFPQNNATAVAIEALATANFLIHGEPTPTPFNVVTATPTPTWVIITSVPTPGNAATAEARAAATATAARAAGTATPLPPNWVTPIVVTATPLPGNAATAEVIMALATASALSTGTATATPPNMWTATPTPVFEVAAVVDPTVTPEPTPTPTADPDAIPAELVGRIGFISDRAGGEPGYYVMDPDGSHVQRLSGPGWYSAGLVRDTLDPSGQYQVIVTEPRNPSHDAKLGTNYEISLLRLADGYQWYIIGGTKGADYQPAYCMADPRYIAYTSQQAGNDEIFVVDLLSSEGRDVPLQTVRLTQNDWEWDKHPSWSPDCTQIVFHSNRDGRSQIWLMDFQGMGYPGANERNISGNPYNDWDPVWFKAPRGTP
jgi:hypothetical protein